MSVPPFWALQVASLPRSSQALGTRDDRAEVRPQAPSLASHFAAVWISRIASPPLVAIALLVRVVDGTAAPRAWAWAVLFALPAVVTPALAVAALVRAGRIVDFDLSDRRQRHVPFAVATLCAAGSTGAMAALGGPPTFVAFGTAWCALLGLLSAVTLRWKISLHGAAAGAAACLSLAAGGADIAFWLMVPPAVGWARVVLGRHTQRQVIAGTAVGIAAIALAAASL